MQVVLVAILAMTCTVILLSYPGGVLDVHATERVLAHVGRRLPEHVELAGVLHVVQLVRTPSTSSHSDPSSSSADARRRGSAS